MKLPQPLFGKIAVLFVANVLVLALALAWLLNQGWGMTAMPVVRSNQLETVGNALLRKLEQSPFKEWTAVLAEASKEHRVQFMLYSTDGPLLAGPNLFLPGNVHSEIVGVSHLPGDEDVRDLPVPPPMPVQSPDSARPILTSSSGYWCFIRGYLTHAEGAGKVALVTQSDSPTGHGFYASTNGIFWLIAGALIISALLWLPFVRSFTRRLRTMQNAAGRLAVGDFTARAEDRSPDELGALGHSLNHMADQIGSMVDGQKRLLGDIAHELSSPIARMQAIAGILETADASKRGGYVERLEDELGQMGTLVQELLSLSKASLRRSIELRPIHLRQQVQRVIEREKHNGETIELRVPEHLRVMSDPELLSRAIGNVLRNAIRYAGHAGPIVIDATSRDDRALITVTDSGPGVPESALPHLFDAFYRPDVARARETGGSGLGLAIVKSCVEATQGSVGVRNHVGSSGLVVEIEQMLA